MVKIVAESQETPKRCIQSKNVDGNYKMIGCARSTSKFQLLKRSASQRRDSRTCSVDNKKSKVEGSNQQGSFGEVRDGYVISI